MKKLLALLLLLSSPAMAHETDQHCLAKTIYHEARGESINGQYQVGAVILNRVASKRFPNTVCGVVNQPHQFSPDRNRSMIDVKAKTLALTIAADLLRSYLPAVAPVHFLSYMPKLPGWAQKLKPVFVVGRHTFY